MVGGLAYVAGSALRILDLSNPVLRELGALDIGGGDVEVVGGLAYVVDGGLRIIDVSNPAAPVELGALDTPDTAQDVEVVGGLAYVADGPSGLRIVDFGPEYTDTDADSVVAGIDNCPTVPNANQQNSDLLLAGDDCQCSDLDADGLSNILDLVLARRIDSGASVPVDPARCIIDFGLNACEAAGILGVRRTLAELGPPLVESCPAP